MNNSNSSTRQTSQIYGLGSGICEDDAEIRCSKLPSNRQIIRCTMWHIQNPENSNQTKWQSGNLVLQKIIPFYQKANLPMISDKKCIEKILKLVADNAKMREIPMERRKMPNAMKKVEVMNNYLEKTFCLWPAAITLKNQEDMAFLNSMKTDRIATFGSHDKTFTDKIKRTTERKEQEIKRRKKHLATHESFSNKTLDHIEIDSNSSTTSYENDQLLEQNDSVQSHHHHRSRRTGTHAFIPHDILKREKVVSIATRLQITPTQQSAFVKALVEESGGVLAQLSTSYSTADRSRRSTTKTLADNIKETWKCPSLATVHWDSKSVSSLCNKYESEERLAVLVGNQNETKLLGTPSYKSGTDQSAGDIVSSLTVNLLHSWRCTENIVNMTFDTTASNTGHISAACISIQTKLDKALLWSGCRHHIGEVILSHVFSALQIETSKSPDISVFTRFRHFFSSIPHSNIDVNNLSCSDYSELNTDANTFLSSLRHSFQQLNLCSQKQVRDDYEELLDLSNIFLGTNDSLKKITFKKPGALHKARWMAKIIYSIKMCLLQKEILNLPSNPITNSHVMEKLQQFSTFVSHVYCSWWLSCSSAVDAPWNDLMFLKNLKKYECVNKLISNVAVKAFSRHLWYLTSEMVPLALFSRKTPAQTRQNLAHQILINKPHDVQICQPKYRFGTGYGKPKFPDVSDACNLEDLVGSDAWFTIKLLKIDSAFMELDTNEWDKSDAYNLSAQNIQSISVVNDTAERGVKLSCDFVGTSRSEHHYQNVLQVVEDNRKQYPNLRRKFEVNKVKDSNDIHLQKTKTAKLAAESPLLSIVNPEDWVAVIYNDCVNDQWYLGKVIHVVNDRIMISYMREICENK
jgi:hypothetical protein